jgi:hypothetical protein
VAQENQLNKDHFPRGIMPEADEKAAGWDGSVVGVWEDTCEQPPRSSATASSHHSIASTTLSRRPDRSREARHDGSAFSNVGTSDSQVPISWPRSEAHPMTSGSTMSSLDVHQEDPQVVAVPRPKTAWSAMEERPWWKTALKDNKV